MGKNLLFFLLATREFFAVAIHVEKGFLEVGSFSLSARILKFSNIVIQ